MPASHSRDLDKTSELLNRITDGVLINEDELMKRYDPAQGHTSEQRTRLRALMLLSRQKNMAYILFTTKIAAGPGDRAPEVPFLFDTYPLFGSFRYHLFRRYLDGSLRIGNMWAILILPEGVSLTRSRLEGYG